MSNHAHDAFIFVELDDLLVSLLLLLLFCLSLHLFDSFFSFLSVAVRRLEIVVFNQTLHLFDHFCFSVRVLTVLLLMLWINLDCRLRVIFTISLLVTLVINVDTTVFEGGDKLRYFGQVQ